MRDGAREFPLPESPAQVRTARIWHCKYRSLAPVAQLTGVRQLSIATFPDDSLEALASLTALEELQIVHLPKVHDLSPLSGLTNLRSLSLQTLPSWDASGMVTEVESLTPISSLTSLERLELFGVVPKNRSVDSVIDMPSLRHLRVSQFPEAEGERAQKRFPSQS